jgi:hypothetical protein
MNKFLKRIVWLLQIAIRILELYRSQFKNWQETFRQVRVSVLVPRVINSVVWL